jgi:hypothetical protein
VCKCVLPPGDNPTAVNKYIIINLDRIFSNLYSILLGSIVKGNNSTEEEIKGGISLRNKVFYANQDLFKSKLLSKKPKVRIYQTLVRPVVTYACET